MLMNSFLSILILLLSPLIVLSNTLIISVWLRFKRLRTPSNALIISLAVADLGFGLFLPAAVALELTLPSPNSTPGKEYECKIACVIPFAILLTFCSASLLSITLIALDRFTSVSQPLRYNHFVKMSSIHRVVSFCWIYSILIGVAIPVIFLARSEWPLWGGELVLGWLAIFLYGPCLLSVIISYGYIYIIARNHARAIYSVEVSLHNGNTCEITDTATLGHTNRYGLTLALILTSILISWMPLLILAFCDLVAYHNSGSSSTTFDLSDNIPSTIQNDGDFNVSIIDKTDVTSPSSVTTTNNNITTIHHNNYDMILMNPQWRMMACLPLVLSSLINPWLYGYRSSEMRVAVIRLIDWVVTKVTGRASSVDILYTYHKGDLTSCASNVRLLGISPTQTTVQCCSPSPNADRKHSNLSIHLMICDNQVSSL